MSRVDVSVVIPTKNRARVLLRCLDALLRQDFQGSVEILIADDGSSDDTRRVVEEMARVAPVHMRIRYLGLPRRSANAARNAAVQVAAGRIIVLTDDDVIASVGWLRALTRPILAGEVEATTGPVTLEGGLSLPGRHPDELASLLGHVEQPSVLLLGNLAVCREVFRRGLFDPDTVAPVEEIEWIARVRPRWQVVPEAAVIHAKDPATLRFWPLVRTAWRRGLAGGQYARKTGEPRVVDALLTAARAAAHAGRHRCAGGLIVAIASLGRAVGAARG